MVARNNITGDSLQSKPSNKLYLSNYDKIKPNCFSNCTYLIDTLQKCKLCAWRPALADVRGGAFVIVTPEGRDHFYEQFKYSEDWQDESRSRAIAQNGNVGYD